MSQKISESINELINRLPYTQLKWESATTLLTSVSFHVKSEIHSYPASLNGWQINVSRQLDPKEAEKRNFKI